LGSQLVRQPVSQRVRKRHAEFQDVHAVGEECATDFERGVEIRIAGADVRHKGGTILSPGPGKRLLDS
jgi:hypothetical protein